MKELCRHPHRARFARSTARMSYAQAKAAALSRRDRKAIFAAAIMTVIYYYCFPDYSYACQGLRFRFALALLKLFSLVDLRLRANRLKRKIVFVYARPAGDRLRFSRETVVAIRRLLSL